jgi:predicted O-methyltransferase YrrM
MLREMSTMGLTSTLAQIPLRVRRDFMLARFAGEQDPTVRAVALALKRTLARDSTPIERAWIDRLEELRGELERSTAVINRLDYGAGTPTDHRTPEEMAAGVVVEDELGRVCRTASKNPFWCGLLFRLIRALRPASCIELGTAVGMSASYLGAALHLNSKGALTTLEGSESLADVARQNLVRLGLTNVDVVTGRFQDTLDGVLARRAPVDFVFIDGHHDEAATLQYFERILTFSTERAVIVFDDIDWNDGMRRAWRTVSKDQSLGLSLDMGPVGLCLVDRRGSRHRSAKVVLGKN